MSQGIFGVIDFNKRIDNPDTTLTAMGKFLEQDETAEISYEWGGDYALGMKRIARSADQQTQIFQDREQQTLCLIHGEIHNDQSTPANNLAEGPDVKKDLESALQMYAQHGPQFARELNGLFSIAVVDLRRKSFFLLHDRFGMSHQVYWTVIDGRLCFATHLKTLLMYPGIKKEIDIESLNLFLKYAYIPSPHTIFKGIQKLPSGHMLTFRDREAAQESYWEFGETGRKITDMGEAVPKYKELLTKSIERRLGSVDNVGILLSGGLDSSANVALAAQCTEKRLKTFAVGFEDPAFDERPFARIVADRFNTNHFEYTVTGEEIEDLPKLLWNLEEPYFEFGFFLTYLGMASAQNEVDIVLGGEGADQMYGTGGFVKGLPVALRYLVLKCHLEGVGSGLSHLLKGKSFYERDNLAFKLRLLLNRVLDLNDWYFYGYDEHELGQLYKDRSLARVPRIFQNDSRVRPSSFEALYTETQIEQDIKHYVNENVMVKSGRMADMLGLTLRESYLDTEVVDFLLSLDYSLRRSGGLVDHLKGNIKTKLLHREAMKGLLPKEIMEKPKQGGFVPVMLFLKNPDLRKRIYHHLLNSEVIRRYFRTEYLSSIFSNYESTQGQKIYWPNFYNSKANRVLFLLTFEIWHHQYMTKQSLDTVPVSLSDYLN